MKTCMEGLQSFDDVCVCVCVLNDVSDELGSGDDL